MIDGIMKGTGNSRLLKSPATIPATFEDFRAALIAGTLPIDLLYNAAGWDVEGTPLNKANLLTDATAALYGETTINNVLAAIKAILGKNTNYNTKLTSNLTLTASTTSSGSITDVLSLSLPAGTYLVSGRLTTVGTSTGSQCDARISDKTTHYGASESNLTTSYATGTSHNIVTIITLAATTTIYLQAQYYGNNNGTALATASYMTGTNRLTELTAVKIG